MENRDIEHSQFSASADLPDFGLSYARLNGPKAWLGKHPDLNQWFQVSFKNPSRITGISMQGRQDKDEWVTRYTVMTKMGQLGKYYRWGWKYRGTVKLRNAW